MGEGEPMIQQISPLLVTYGPPIFLVLVAYGLAWITYKYNSQQNSLTPGFMGRLFDFLPDWFPFRRTMKLQRAARLAYEQTQDTNMAGMAEHASRRSGNEADLFSLYVRYLIGDGTKIKLWGCPKPSTRSKEIDVRGTVTIENEGERIVQHKDPEIVWEPVWVLVKDLKQRIKEIQKGE